MLINVNNELKINSYLQTSSAAMKLLLSWLSQHPCLEIVVFEEETILHQPIEEWPICNCLLAFFSLGFPLDKAIAYWHLRKPMLINDLEAQYDLLDRLALTLLLFSLSFAMQDCCT